MPVNARFRERMVGPIVRSPLDRSHSLVSLAARPDVVGDDIIEAARAASLTSPPSSDAHAAVLDLSGLDLRVDAQVDERDGFRAAVVGGWVSGVGPEADGPVVSGFADLLFCPAPGERRMYYRLVVGGDRSDGRAGWFVVEGVKVVVGPIRRSWAQTTTLFTRVTRLPDGEPGARAAVRPDRAIEGVDEIAAGVLRILPSDLTRQALSMRGPVALFLAAFFGRLLVRRPLGAERYRARAQSGPR